MDFTAFIYVETVIIAVLLLVVLYTRYRKSKNFLDNLDLKLKQSNPVFTRDELAAIRKLVKKERERI